METVAASQFLAKPIVYRIAAEVAVRPMRGESRAFLMYCSNRSLYVVKFPACPPVPASEMLATLMAIWVGLPFPAPALVKVPAGLACQRRGLMPGLHFGSGFVERCVDAFPAAMFGRVSNRRAFAGVLAFDLWTANNHRRQAVFVRQPDKSYEAVFIDNGSCFNFAGWNHSDKPARAAGRASLPYREIRSWESFEPWLTKIENFPERILLRLAEEIPEEWCGHNGAALRQLCHVLLEGRAKLRRLIAAFRDSSEHPFPNWNQDERLLC